MATESKEPFITIYKAIGGWQTALWCWYEEDQMWDCVQTGMGPYRDIKHAEIDAYLWAKVEGAKVKR